MSRSQRIWRWAGVLLMSVGLVAIAVGGMQMGRPGVDGDKRSPGQEGSHQTAIPTLRVTLTPEPIVPTRTPGVGHTLAPSTPAADDVPSATAGVAGTPITVAPTTVSATTSAVVGTVGQPVPADPESEVKTPFTFPIDQRWRLGVSLPYGATRADGLAALGVGWVMDWSVRGAPTVPDGVAFAQTVRMWGDSLRTEAVVLTTVARARPGSWWLIGNEPDVRWQDSVTPEVYARLYREAYNAIKAGDPTAVVAAGGIAQPSDLRLRYLDLVLQSYQTQFGEPLRAQAWHIHNYMPREERDSWGIDIPPGISDNQGVLHQVDDSGNLALFEEQIRVFRRWMASRGYGGQPLAVSEFGIPMPADYGYPPEIVAAFLQDTWRFFLTAMDGTLGDPTDEGRLVQKWCWFSMAYPDYPTGDLMDMDTKAWTPLGRAWLAMAAD